MAVALSACAPTAYQQDWGFDAQPSEQTTLSIKNNSWGEMAIYAVIGATRSRLGTVPGSGTAELVIPRTLMRGLEVQIQADPVGPGPAFTFPLIAVRPGSQLELWLESDLAMSNLSVR